MGMLNLTNGADSVDLVAKFACLSCIPILCEAKEVVPEIHQLWYRLGPLPLASVVVKILRRREEPLRTEDPEAS